MIDLVRIQIPIKTEYMVEIVDKETGRTTGGEVDVAMFAKYGCKLAAGQVDISKGQTHVSRLYHPFESIPSSNSSVAFKIRAGGHNYFPHVELNASPAKLLQGHNAYGTTDFEKCISAVFYAFTTAFHGIEELLQPQLAEVCQMDFTYSAFLENQFMCKQLIEALRHVSTGQIRTARQSFETSAMWNAGSSHCVRLAYIKYFEVKRQIEELKQKQKQSSEPHIQRQLEQLQSDAVQDYIKSLVRFEAKVKKRTLKRLGIPTVVKDLIPYAENYKGDLAQYIWTEAFKDIFATFEGATVNIYDDEQVLEALKATYQNVTVKGNVTYSKALRVMRFFRSIKNEGFDQVKRNTPEKTFYRNLNELTSVIPRVQIQGLHSVKTNVVPLVRLINVDFSKQHPAGWQEPLHMSQQLTGCSQPLRLVG